MRHTDDIRERFTGMSRNLLDGDMYVGNPKP